jgi:hypothetical protein
MSFVKVTGRVESFIESTSLGYATVGNMTVTAEDGRKTIIREMHMRSDMLLLIQHCQSSGEPAEIYIEKRSIWQFGSQCFGLKTNDAVLFDARNLALFVLGALPALALFCGLIASLFMGPGGMVVAIALVGLFTLVAPLPLSTALLVWTFATRVDRKGLFYGDANETLRLKAMEPSTI